ncbi:hypothetical protein [Streptomyces azureus]|uniref:Uncharacterized protein n=1 Tax=Streptomyces azureus TaxID=146537 RepID=A0A0K8PKY4_STRAJ|nr:hypothetical protein [Streptomyces azureus]GAP48555.1 uncharacterized protein SAZU_3381 [Streptomyces azureus]
MRRESSLTRPRAGSGNGSLWQPADHERKPVRTLRDNAPAQVAGGSYDDDLLSVVVARRPQVREHFPDLAHV